MHSVRDTETDGSYVTIISAEIGDDFTLSVSKNSHFSFNPSHYCGAEIRNEAHTFRCQKNSRALFQSDYYGKRGSASYIVREVREVRERERERERERYREREREREIQREREKDTEREKRK